MCPSRQIAKEKNLYNMKSMTGFAKKQRNINGKNITVEIKTLNSKQIDANVKIPQRLREHELDIRSMLNKLERGKIDLFVTEEQTTGGDVRLDIPHATRRFEEMKKMKSTLGIEIDDKELFTITMGADDLWTADEESAPDEEEWKEIASLVEETIEAVDATRIHEGAILKEDFVKHVDMIEHYLGEIPQYEAERITTAKERMRSYLNGPAIKDVDNNRFEQELIYYLEKLDITEEKVRLAKHINYFREVMENEESSGKKLGFIAQEMGREINTTGSKANHVEIQRIVVGMKDELEKIKEQLGNIL